MAEETAYDDFNTKIIAEFRANEGRVGGPFEGAPMALVTTTGAKTGRRTTSPMMYLLEDGHTYVFASKGGAPTNPAWYHNMLANPEVTVEIGTETRQATAAPVTGPERDRIYAKQAGLYTGFADYQKRTTRVIPVVELRFA
ncbi:MAG TPA: nitroreductase family deazaflavin-dependent oxidoreductase [Streptosporangiaceae bacterium]|jgi:deazaflavin-dependent oxidoreductase (nitroreductase family)